MTKRLLCILVVIPALTVAAALGQTTTISDATRAAGGALTDEQAAEVEAFITFCTQRMIDPASNVNVVKSCRVAMVSTYGGNLGEGFMSHFARTTQRVFVPAVLKVEQSPVVQINGAMVVADIARPELAPLLAQMFTHPNPAVRYYAVKGFDRIAPAVVALGGDEPKKMLDTLGAFAQRTQNPAMVRALMQALDLSDISPDNVTPTALNAARAQALDIIGRLLDAHLQAIRDGNANMADAVAFGVEALAAMGRDLGEEQRKGLLGAIARVAANTGEAFGELSIADENGIRRLVPTAGAITMLLVHCERAIGTLTGSRQGAVSRELPPQKEADVNQALIELNDLIGAPGTDGDLQKLGVPVPMRLPRSPEVVRRER